MVLDKSTALAQAVTALRRVELDAVAAELERSGDPAPAIAALRPGELEAEHVIPLVALCRLTCVQWGDKLVPVDEPPDPPPAR